MLHIRLRSAETMSHVHIAAATSMVRATSDGTGQTDTKMETSPVVMPTHHCEAGQVSRSGSGVLLLDRAQPAPSNPVSSASVEHWIAPWNTTVLDEVRRSGRAPTARRRRAPHAATQFLHLVVGIAAAHQPLMFRKLESTHAGQIEVGAVIFPKDPARLGAHRGPATQRGRGLLTNGRLEGRELPLQVRSGGCNVVARRKEARLYRIFAG